MFGKLKDKLKSWIKKSAEEIETTELISEEVETPLEETPENPSEPQPSKKEIKQKKKEAKKQEKQLAKLQKQLKKQEKELESEKQELKNELPEINKLEELEKEIQKEKKELESEKQELQKELQKEISKPHLEFDNTIQAYKSDLEKIKQEQEELVEKTQEPQTESSEKVPEEVIQGYAGEKHTKEFDESEVVEEEQFTKEIEEKTAEEPSEKPEKEKSFLSKIKSRLSYKITREEFDSIFDDLEMLLLENNVALEVTEDIKSNLSEKLIDKEIKKQDLEEEIKTELKRTLNEILIEPDDPLDAIIEKKQSEHMPFVILFFGINGTGKTTSIAKLTNKLQKNNLSVVLAAADTFRAASIEQIQIHADRLNVPLIKQDYGADPSAVGFDAIRYAEKHKIDVVLIDTAGRMHTKTNLLAEMEKICRVTKPDLKILVAESIAGNDATEQARSFHEMIEIDGSILSKADIDEKGGTIISVSHATHKPIFYLGTGQEYEDLELFDKQKFIENLGL